MLTNTFIHIQSIGAITEQRLWESGIRDWDTFSGDVPIPISAGRQHYLLKGIEESQRHLANCKPEYFSKKGTSGIRSPIITPQGKFLLDVMEIENEHSFNIINYNSPGATGAPAYSAFIVQKLAGRLYLVYYSVWLDVTNS